MPIKLKPFQDKFLFSERRFPALIAGIGTGKTYMLLLKIWKFCEEYPDSLALIVRKEFTDLHDSTMKDFERYFGVHVNSDKEYHFANGSTIMFRHAAEIEVLKNINLSIFGIEQAEEFETEEQFIFLRDRLRRPNSPYRQGCVIANANGHNWIWKLWVNNPPSEDYDLSTATTFDNADNLPDDFISDLRRMEIESPNHYRQYVLNSFEEMDADDLLLTYESVRNSLSLEFREGSRKKVLSVDVARYGEDETVFTILESRNVLCWQQVLQEQWKNKSLMETVGKIIDLIKTHMVDLTVIDDGGLGGGVVDRLNELRHSIMAFNGSAKSSNPKYSNARSEGFFRLKEMFDKNYLRILDDDTLIEQLMTIRYKYKSNGEKAIVSKDEMRKEGLKSPDRADALMMAVYACNKTMDTRQVMGYHDLQREAVAW